MGRFPTVEVSGKKYIGKVYEYAGKTVTRIPADGNSDTGRR
jgi:hypothetical protein